MLKSFILRKAVNKPLCAQSTQGPGAAGRGRARLPLLSRGEEELVMDCPGCGSPGRTGTTGAGGRGGGVEVRAEDGEGSGGGGKSGAGFPTEDGGGGLQA